MKKKLLTLMLALVMALSTGLVLAACGEDEPAPKKQLVGSYVSYYEYAPTIPTPMGTMFGGYLLNLYDDNTFVMNCGFHSNQEDTGSYEGTYVLSGADAAKTINLSWVFKGQDNKDVPGTSGDATITTGRFEAQVPLSNGGMSKKRMFLEVAKVELMAASEGTAYAGHKKIMLGTNEDMPFYYGYYLELRNDKTFKAYCYLGPTLRPVITGTYEMKTVEESDVIEYTYDKKLMAENGIDLSDVTATGGANTKETCTRTDVLVGTQLGVVMKANMGGKDIEMPMAPKTEVTLAKIV